MKRECSRCQFYQTLKDARMGLCKRRPPIPIFMGMQMHAVTREPIPLVIANFPTMDNNDWCGEFQQRGMGKEAIEQGETITGETSAIDWTKLRDIGPKEPN